jgi:TorA maturation chaperone TorD
MSDAIAAHPRADFYRALAGFTRAFVDVEAQGFDLLG